MKLVPFHPDKGIRPYLKKVEGKYIVKIQKKLLYSILGINDIIFIDIFQKRKILGRSE